MNATQRGNISRNKTKKYYEARGYDVAVIEQAKFWVFGGKRFASKKDCFAADLCAMNGKEIIFIQCKSSEPRIAECRREFEKYKYPSFVKKVVVCWQSRVKEPIIKKI